MEWKPQFLLCEPQDSRRRYIAKSITWRIIGILILGAITWYFTHSWEKVTFITVTFHVIRAVLYYYHEALWDRIAWGRNNHK